MVSRAKINPEMMKWARINAGYTGSYESNLPKNIKENYKKWESGDRFPTWNQLEMISNKYHLPSIFFFRKTAPKENNQEFIEYRTLENENTEMSPDLINAINVSKYRRNIYLELIQDLSYPKKTFEYKINSNNTVEEVTQYMRSILNIDLNTQKSWTKKDKKHYLCLKNWKKSFEKIGILIFETENVDILEIRGLTIYYESYPIILLNGKDSVNGRIFSLFHELTHLLKYETATCDTNDNNKEEEFCNAVAGSFLVPKKDFINQEIILNHNTNQMWKDNELKKLSNTYGVSREVILRSLLNNNKITKEFYNKKKDEWNNITKPKKKRSGGNYIRNRLKYNSQEFSKVVVDAYEKELINSVEFSRYLNLSSKHLEKLESYLYPEDEING